MIVLLVALGHLSSVRAGEPTQMLGVQIADVMPVVKASLDNRGIAYTEVGPNAYTQGPMLQVAGASFKIEGLKSVHFIFTPQHKLAGAVLTLGKARYRDLVGVLKQKYQPIDELVAIVGDQAIELKASDGTRIYATAPHMSYEMTVSYISEEMYLMKEVVRASAMAKRVREAQQF